MLQYLPNVITNVSQRGQDQYILDLQMSRPSLQRIWSLVFSPAMSSKLSNLFAIELLGSFVIRSGHQKLSIENRGKKHTMMSCNNDLLANRYVIKENLFALQYDFVWSRVEKVFPLRVCISKVSLPY